MHMRNKNLKHKDFELNNPEHSIETIISEWLKNKPGWYSAALHAALANTCGSEVIDALANAACKESSVRLDIESPVELKDYQPSDIANTGISSREVILKSITATSGINAIPQGSKLDIAHRGLNGGLRKQRLRQVWIQQNHKKYGDISYRLQEDSA